MAIERLLDIARVAIKGLTGGPADVMDEAGAVIDRTRDTVKGQWETALERDVKINGREDIPGAEKAFRRGVNIADYGIVGTVSEAIQGGASSVLGGMFGMLNYGLKKTPSLIAGAGRRIGSGIKGAGTAIASNTPDWVKGVGKGVGTVGLIGALGVGIALTKTAIYTAKGVGFASKHAVWPTMKYAGRGAKTAGKMGASDMWRGAKFVARNRNSPTAAIGLAAFGSMYMIPAAIERGEYKSDLAYKSQNKITTNDGGGTFLRPIGQGQLPQGPMTNGPGVDNFGANGDLVFALHNLRHGG